MTAFHGHTFLTQNEISMAQIEELQHAVQVHTRKLEEVQQKRLRAEEDIIQCTRETEQRVDLIMERSGVVDVLKQLGHLLQQERHLSEQLNAEAPADRNQRNDLQERSERITNKARSLSAEIVEVNQCLTEAKARNMAAQALIHAPSSKSKRAQSKPK